MLGMKLYILHGIALVLYYIYMSKLRTIVINSVLNIQ